MLDNRGENPDSNDNISSPSFENSFESENKNLQGVEIDDDVPFCML